MGIKLILGFFDQLKKDKFTGDTVWLVLSQIVLISSGLLVNLIIGYQFGADTLGVFNQILGFYLILSTFFSLGINNAIIQKIASSEKRYYSDIFSSNLAITTVSTLFFSTLTIGVASFYPPVFSSSDLAKGLIIAAFSLPFFNWNKNFMAYCTGVRNQKLFSNIRSVRWLMIIGVIGLIAIYSDDPGLLYWSFIVSEVFIFIFFLFKFQELISFGFEKSEVFNNLVFGLKSFTAELFSIMNDKLDLIIIGYLISSTEVGVYSFLIFFAKSLYIFPGILQQNINPIIGKHWVEQRMDELKKLLKGIRMANLIVVVIQALSILVFYKLLTDYYMVEFQGSLSYLAFSMIGVIPLAFIAWGGGILVMTGRLNSNIQRTLFLLIFTILSTLVLVNHFGLQGAVWALVLNGLFGFLLLFGFVKRETGIKLV